MKFQTPNSKAASPSQIKLWLLQQKREIGFLWLIESPELLSIYSEWDYVFIIFSAKDDTLVFLVTIIINTWCCAVYKNGLFGSQFGRSKNMVRIPTQPSDGHQLNSVDSITVGIYVRIMRWWGRKPETWKGPTLFFIITLSCGNWLGSYKTLC